MMQSKRQSFKGGAFNRKRSCEESGHCVYGLGVCLPDAKFILSLGGAVDFKK